MRLLQNWIGMGNQWARFPQPETQLAKQPLALTHSQPDLVAPRQPSLERFAIPQRSLQPSLARRPSQHCLHLFHLRVTQPFGPPRARPLDQTAQPTLFKPPHPVFHRPGSVAQKPTDPRAGHSLGHQQDPVQAVIVTRFLRTANLILKSQNYRIGISNGQWFHAPMKPQSVNIRNYL